MGFWWRLVNKNMIKFYPLRELCAGCCGDTEVHREKNCERKRKEMEKMDPKVS